MPDYPLRNKTAVVGLGTSNFRELYYNPDPKRDPIALGVDVLRQAVADAGLRLSDIDGLMLSGVVPNPSNYPNFAYRAGLRDVGYLVPYVMSGRYAGMVLAHAAMAVHSGAAKYVACIYSSAAKSVQNRFGGGEGGELYDPIFGMTSPGAQYAMLYNRYIDKFGFKGKDHLLGAVPISMRKHARLNPTATMQEQITIEQYLNSRYIARPLRLYDYCLISDGAVCYIVTTAERAKSMPKPPAYISSFSTYSTLWEMYVPPDGPEAYWHSYAQTMVKEVLERANLTRKDISSFEIYDNFAPDVIWSLEGAGFCKQGEGLEWIQNGRIEPNGELPVNTSGGLNCDTYMQGWNLIAEAIRQVRGECGPRQLKKCNAILYAVLAGVSNMAILSRG